MRQKIVGDDHRIVILSPHLDDAVFSLGAAIASWSKRGANVTILTIFAGLPTWLPQVGRRFHHKYGLAVNIVTLRRGEDTAAAAVVGAHPIHLDYLDAVYRHHRGRGVYLSIRDILEADMSNEPELVDAILHDLVHLEVMRGADVVYVPLALGGHIDHRIVRAAAEQWEESVSRRSAAMRFYEDFPYVARISDAELRAIAARAEPVFIRAGELDWQTKLRAATCYTSQMPIMWPGRLSYADELARYAEAQMWTSAFTERIWQLRSRQENVT